MRTLKRPMFKKGGSANEGIMTGLVDRRGYSNGEGVNLSRDQYKKFQSLDPIDLRKEWEKQFTAEGLQQQGTYVNPLAGQHGFDVASQGQLQDIDWFAQASPQLKEADFLAWKEAKGKDLVAKQKEYEELSTIGEEKLKPDVVSVIEKKTTGDIDGIDRNQLQQIIADKKEGLSDKAKKYAELLSPNAMKRATTDALTAASKAGQTSTGNTFQDLTNMITAAAEGSGGARDTLDKANLLALQEEIQTNVAKATYKPNTIETTIALGRSSNKEDQKMFKALTKGSNVDSAMIIELAKIETGDNKIQKATGKMYEVKANAANAEQYGGDLPITFNTKTKTDEESFDKMEKGKEYFNYLDGNFYALDENGQPALINKPDYLK